MFKPHLIATVNQRIFSLLAKFPDKEFYERQIARTLGIGYGSANRALNELYSAGAIKRRREGKMYFYSVDASNPIVIEFKKLVNLTLIEPLVEELKNASNRVVLYGSCAQGIDNSESDMDLFVVSNDRRKVLEAVSNFRFPRGFEDIHIQAVVKTPVELLEARGPEQAFIEEVERGIVLWEKVASESRV
jgi:DNA-binding transcriptional ArsR family regulator